MNELAVDGYAIECAESSDCREQEAQRIQNVPTVMQNAIEQFFIC